MPTTKLTNLRNKVTDFARSYKYLFELSALNNAGALASLLTDDIKNKLRFSCVTTPMPSKGSQEITVEVGTYTMREPGRKEFGGTITPEFIMNGDYGIYNFFEAWHRLCTGDDGKNSFASDIHAVLTIKALNSKDSISMVKTYANVWCRLCPEVQFSDDANEIIRFQPELVYEIDVNEFPGGESNFVT